MSMVLSSGLLWCVLWCFAVFGGAVLFCFVCAVVLPLLTPLASLAPVAAILAGACGCLNPICQVWHKLPKMSCCGIVAQHPIGCWLELHHVSEQLIFLLLEKALTAVIPLQPTVNIMDTKNHPSPQDKHGANRLSSCLTISRRCDRFAHGG